MWGIEIEWYDRGALFSAWRGIYFYYIRIAKKLRSREAKLRQLFLNLFSIISPPELAIQIQIRTQTNGGDLQFIHRMYLGIVDGKGESGCRSVYAIWAR